MTDQNTAHQLALQIHTMRKNLAELVSRKGSFMDPEVLERSKELDQLIVEYQKFM